MTGKDLAKRIKSKTPPCVLDVRSFFEFRGGHIPGALHSPLWKILFRLAGLPKDKQNLIVVTCEHGPRAQMAKSLLGLSGYSKVDLLEGHMSAWRRQGLPMHKK